MFKKTNLIIFIILLIAVLGLWQWSNQSKTAQPNNEQLTGQTQGSINVKFSFSETEIVNLNHPYAENISANLLTITQSLAKQQSWEFESKDYGEMGSLVTKIGEKTNGQDQKYWQFYINGEQPMLSADKFTPKNGDQIEWRFAESKF